MAFTPDDIRRNHAINDDAAKRRAKESHALQALENLRNATNTASNRRDLFAAQKKEILGQLATAVSHKSLPAGVSANDLMAMTFGNDRKRRSEMINDEDLAQYAQNVNTAAEKFTGGITPQQVIDWSAPIDIKRSNNQIHLAVMTNRKDDKFRYMTNAGPDSKDQYHYVDVQFLGFGDMLTGSRDKGVKSIKDYVINGKIKFVCDCGRHRFYYSYLASLGKYHLGVNETRFPFIRNPYLFGVGCKHVLRVMQVITGAAYANEMLNYVKKDRAKLDASLAGKDKTSRKDFKATLDRQIDRLNHRSQQVTPTEHRAGYRRKMQAAAQKAAKKAAEAEAARLTNAQVIKERQARYDQLLAKKLISQEDYDFMTKGNK